VLTEGSTGVRTGVPLRGNTGLTNSDGDNDNPSPLVARTADESDSDDEDDNDADGTNAIESHHDDIPDDEVYHPHSMTSSVQRTYGLRPRKPQDYSHMYAHATVMHHAMIQYSLRKGLKKFQKVGGGAASRERGGVTEIPCEIESRVFISSIAPISRCGGCTRNTL
jgi:hypothetical protein